MLERHEMNRIEIDWALSCEDTGQRVGVVLPSSLRHQHEIPKHPPKAMSKIPKLMVKFIRSTSCQSGNPSNVQLILLLIQPNT